MTTDTPNELYHEDVKGLYVNDPFYIAAFAGATQGMFALGLIAHTKHLEIAEQAHLYALKAWNMYRSKLEGHDAA